MAKGKKTGGRVAGTPNKKSAQLREYLAQMVNEYKESGQMELDLSCLEPKDRLTIYEKYMQYSLPKLQAVEFKGEIESKVTLADTLVQLSEENDR